jgi:hypothetical protein
MDLAPPFLRLPGELRNRVYAYTFFEEKGVCYREDKNGVAWLCLHSFDQDAPINTVAGTLITTADEDGDEGLPRTKRRKLSNGTPQHTQSKCELTKKDARVRACEYQYIVANQLQFVNRQLRCETRGLSLRYNSSVSFDSYLHLGRLFSGINQSQLAWLRILIIRAEDPELEDTTQSIDTAADGRTAAESEGTQKTRYEFDFLTQEYPKLAIHIHTPSDFIGSKDFLLSALITQCHGRGNAAFPNKFSGNFGVQQILTGLMGRLRGSQRRLPPCVKMFPWEEAFDEAAFRQSCATTDQLALFLARTEDFDIERLVAIAKEWYEDGL